MPARMPSTQTGRRRHAPPFLAQSVPSIFTCLQGGFGSQAFARQPQTNAVFVMSLRPLVSGFEPPPVFGRPSVMIRWWRSPTVAPRGRRLFRWEAEAPNLSASPVEAKRRPLDPFSVFAFVRRGSEFTCTFRTKGVEKNCSRCISRISARGWTKTHLALAWSAAVGLRGEIVIGLYISFGLRVPPPPSPRFSLLPRVEFFEAEAMAQKGERPKLSTVLGPAECPKPC